MTSYICHKIENPSLLCHTKMPALFTTFIPGVATCVTSFSELSPMALFYDFKTFFAPQIAIGKWLFYSKSNDISTIEDKFKQDRFSTSFKNLWKNFLGVIPPDSTIMRMSTIIYSRVSRSFTARGFSSRDPTRV